MKELANTSMKSEIAVNICCVGTIKWEAIPKWQQHQEIEIFAKEDNNGKRYISSCF